MFLSVKTDEERDGRHGGFRAWSLRLIDIFAQRVLTERKMMKARHKRRGSCL